MNWETKTIGECVKMLSGGTPKKSREDYWGGNIPWVSSGEMTESFLVDTSLHVTPEGAANGTRLVPENTVLAVVRGMSLAKEFRVSITKRAMTFNQDIKAFECVEGIDPRFLFYALKARKEYIRDLSTDASHGTKKLDTEPLKAVKLLVPETIEEQRAIADVVACYDDLIENNRRRIALLEEAARLLYREWFVHFRFPGHEHVKFIDGVPEGWSIRLLPELCVGKNGIQTGPFGSQLHQSDYTFEGVPVVMPKDLKSFRISTDTIARIPEEKAHELGRHVMSVGDIVYGRRGDIGRRALIGEPEDGFFCGTGCLRIRPDANKIRPLYLFETLGSASTAGFIANQARGSTMLNLSAGALKNVPILCAPNHLQTDFVDLAGTIRKQIEILASQSDQLARARDLLLPRLKDGRLEV